jgi:hypothetical protein
VDPNSKDTLVRVAVDKLKESKKGDDEPKNILVDGQARDEPMPKSNPEHRAEASRERNKEREKERVMDREGEGERDGPLYNHFVHDMSLILIL